jgi:protease IV
MSGVSRRAGCQRAGRATIVGRHMRAHLPPSALRRPARALAGLLALTLSGCVLISGNLNPFSSKPQPLEEHVVSGEGSAKVLLLDVSRAIGSQTEEGALGINRHESTVARIGEELDQAAQDDHVRAVLVRINSPGGTVTASDTVFHEIMDFKAKHHVAVVAQMLDMATSGAYYVALAADEIVASPTTVTGSIGVVMYGVNLSGLLHKLGIADQTLKAGAHKDMGSPLRAMTPRERQLLQGVLRQMQQRFLTVVRERRPNLSAATLSQIADGRILTADQALQDGLVDRIGYLPDALKDAEERAGVSQARVVMYRRPEEFAENIYSRGPLPAPQFNLLNLGFDALPASPQFLYMWLPHD